MIRSVATIVAALTFVQPYMSKPAATQYAKVLREEAKKRHFDPFSLIAIIFLESSWRTTAVSPDERDIGLAQIRVEHLKACRNDPDPVKNPSPACAAQKASLFNGEYAIRYAARRITMSRDFCRRHKKRATYHGWLSVWQGSMTGDKKTWCKANKHTRRVVNLRRKLVRRFGR
jgi:hypothetical protein